MRWEHIERHPPNDRQVIRSMILASPGFIFSEHDIELVVQMVLHAPMPRGDRQHVPSWQALGHDDIVRLRLRPNAATSGQGGAFRGTGKTRWYTLTSGNSVCVPDRCAALPASG